MEEIRTQLKSLQEMQQALQDAQNTDEEKDNSYTVEVLEQYLRTFNAFLNNSMISNNTDKSAEDALTEVLDKLPA